VVAVLSAMQHSIGHAGPQIDITQIGHCASALPALTLLLTSRQHLATPWQRKITLTLGGKQMTRGWRNERTVRTVDTTGRAIDVTTGITTDERGVEVVALSVDDGPSAVIADPDSFETAAAVTVNLQQAQLDLIRRAQRGEQA
ncbi:hypothetical protein, partial [Amycolatopsis sp. NPDC001370]|uniref:hypothetical protein n=2 Tax=unclassified Amycolatopsis TaxID=2618356 RepID=UPI0036C97650